MIKRILNNRFVRFLIAGGINTVFSYCCFAVLMYFLKHKEAAVTINLLIAIFFNYNTSARFVFRDQKMTVMQIVKFYAVYFLTYPLNLLHLYVTVDIWNWNVYLSQFVTLLYMPVINYFLQKKLVFNSSPKIRKEKESL